MKLKYLLSLFCIFSLSNYAQSSNPIKQTEEQSKAVMQAYVNAWNTGTLEALDAVCDTGVVRYDGIAPGYEYRGLPRLKKFIADYRRMFPDFKLVVQEEFYIGDRAILRWLVSGTNTGPGFVPPTGKSFTLSGISLYKFKNGKLMEEKSESDGLYFMEQIGFTLVPPKK